MAVTLAQAALNVQDDVVAGVIDEFQKSNWLMQRLTFDDAVSPTGGGATLTYGYTRLLTQPNADFRAINADYTPQEVTKQRLTVDLKIFGGSYQIDRVISKMGGIVNEVALQSQQKIKAANALFNDTMINGDSATNANAFDGLEKAVTGSSTEYIPAAVIDLSSSSAIDTNYKAFLDELDLFLATLNGTPTGLMMNAKLKARFRACARRSSSYTVTQDDFGKQVESYDGIPFVDLGAKAGSSDPVASTDGTAGTTSLYAAVLGLDGLHAVSIAGESPVQSYLPDFKRTEAVQTGSVEMVAAMALKATKAAGIMRKIKVQ